MGTGAIAAEPTNLTSHCSGEYRSEWRRAVILLASEGRHWRYEVHEHEDGYLVQMRDLDSGDLDAEFSTVFRTLPVAFAYADMSAAFDRFAAAELENLNDAEASDELAATERSFVALSESLRDQGINGPALKAWERRSSPGTPRLVLH
jgi:hypothetical protein